LRLVLWVPALLIVSCTSSAPVAVMRQPSVAGDSLPDGTTEYVLVEDVAKAPFVVIQVDSHGEDHFDLYLRDELAKVGFPPAVTRAQLGRVYLDAGLGDVAQSVDDPISMYQLARVVGPFLLIRVRYKIGGLGPTTYNVSVWDAASSRSVFNLRRSQVVWWSFSRELGPPIVAALAQWRKDCLEAARTMPEQRT
jgi:hypothetical protein